MEAERALAHRVMTLSGAASPTDDIHTAQVLWVCFAHTPDADALAMLHRAAPPHTYLFIREAQPPAALNGYPTRGFTGLDDLSAGFYASLETAQQALWPNDWHAPSLPLPTPFAGRFAEIHHLGEQLLQTDAPVMISGAPGVGKSALALGLAYRLRGEFPAGAFWVPRFGALGAPFSTVLQHLAAAHPAGRAAIARQDPLGPEDVRAWLLDGPGPGLVVADDVRDLDALAALAAVLPPDYRLLVTSPDAPPSEAWHHLALQPLGAGDGLAALGAWLAMPAHLAEEAQRPLQSIVAMLDGHARNLRLAAAWMSHAGGWQSALVYQQRLAEAPNPLGMLGISNGLSDAGERALVLVLNTLNDRDMALWRAAGAFLMGVPFSRGAWLALGDARARPAELVTLGLLEHHPAWGYSLPAQLAPYADVLRLQQDDPAAQTERLLSYYAQHAPDPGQVAHLFDLAAQRSPDALADFVLNTGGDLAARGHTDLVLPWLHQLLASLDDHDERDVSPTTLRALGDLALRLNARDLTQAYYERALLVYYTRKSLSGQANTLKALGDMRAEVGEREAAQEYYDRTLLLYAQIDFQLGLANTLKALGDLSLQNDDHADARNYFNRAAELYIQIDFGLGEAQTLRALGDLAAREQDPLTAHEFYRQALDRFREIDFQSQEAATLAAIGALYMAQYSPERAIPAYTNALHIYRNTSNLRGEAETQAALAEVYQYTGAYDAAWEALQAAQDAYLRHGDYASAVPLALQLADILVQMNRADDALETVLKILRTVVRYQPNPDLEPIRRYLRDMARGLGERFATVWERVTRGQPIPEWLQLAPKSGLPQRLVYALRDLLLSDDWESAQEIVEAHHDVLLTDEADEMLASMLRQYAGQSNQTRQIDKYRALLQRCRQVGVPQAFEEARQPLAEPDSQVKRLQESLDAYDEALQRLSGIPLVYAGIQINRAQTLRELAARPGQERLRHLEDALAAYDDALQNQKGSPPDYAQTQIARADTLHELAALPEADIGVYLGAALAAYDDALAHQTELPEDYLQTMLRRADTLHELALLPDEDLSAGLVAALAAYDEALHTLHQTDLIGYAKTQAQRGLLLHEMAGLPDQDYQASMRAALQAFDEALEYLRDHDALEYARTQSHRVALLRDMAGLPGEERTARLYQALAASNDGLRYLQDDPAEYAQAQLTRAHLQREIAGLSGEHRLARLREALATYQDALDYVEDNPVTYAAVLTSRASLLREMANLGGENRDKRLRQALQAAGEAWLILERLHQTGHQLDNTQRVLRNIRQTMLRGAEDDSIFARAWAETLGTPLPAWLTA